MLDNSENSNDLGLLAQQHEYYDVESDEQIYGKGAKHAVPKDKEVLFEHLVRKVKAINNLKEKLFNELEEMVGCRMLYACSDHDIVSDYVGWLAKKL